MKALLLSALLLMGLAGCSERPRQGPDGCQVIGPVTQGNHITYTVTGYQAGNVAMQKFLDDIAYSSISGEDEVGTYYISFIDQRTGLGVGGKQAQILADELDRRHKISFTSY